MIQSKLFQLILLTIFLFVNLYFVFAYENVITFFLVYGGFVVILVVLLLLVIVFFVTIKFELNILYYVIYLSTVVALLWCLVFTLKKPVRKAFEERSKKRYTYEHSGGRRVFKTELETKAAVAIYNNDTTALKQCIKKGLNVNATGDQGTFLVYAIHSDNPDLPIFKILLDHGADPNVKDGSGNSMAQLCTSPYRGRSKELLKLLLVKGMQVPHYWFFYEEKALDVFLEFGVSINQKFKVSYYESNHKGKQIARSPDFRLVQHAFPNSVLRSGEWTPIMVLASGVWLQKAKNMYARGVDISWKDENGVDLLQILESKKTIVSNNLHDIHITETAVEIQEFINDIKKASNHSEDSDPRNL